MQVILLDKIVKLGEAGDTVDVAPGYARNYLFPKRKAARVTPENVAYYEQRRAELQRLADERRQAAQKRADQLRELGVVTIEARMDENERLYGSVSAREIVKAVQELGTSLQKEEILLPHALRVAGVHDIVLRLHSDVELPFQVALIPLESD